MSYYVGLFLISNCFRLAALRWIHFFLSRHFLIVELWQVSSSEVVSGSFGGFFFLFLLSLPEWIIRALLEESRIVEWFSIHFNSFTDNSLRCDSLYSQSLNPLMLHTETIMLQFCFYLLYFESLWIAHAMNRFRSLHCEENLSQTEPAAASGWQKYYRNAGMKPRKEEF